MYYTKFLHVRQEVNCDLHFSRHYPYYVYMARSKIAKFSLFWKRSKQNCKIPNVVKVLKTEGLKVPNVVRVLIGLLIFFSFSSTSLAVVRDGEIPLGERYAPNQIIVQYKPTMSPDELAAQVEVRQEEKNSFFGFFSYMWKSIVMKIKKQEGPADKLLRIQEMDNKVGVTSRDKLFKGGPQNSPYLLYLKEGSDVLKAVRQYETLPEVEYAEPNQILEIQTNL